MTIESILSSELKEHYGTNNLILQVDGVFYQIPYNIIRNDKQINALLDGLNVHVFIRDRDETFFDDLRDIITVNPRYFMSLIRPHKIEMSKLSFR